MSMIVWILLGLGLGLLASKLVRATGEGTPSSTFSSASWVRSSAAGCSTFSAAPG